VKDCPSGTRKIQVAATLDALKRAASWPHGHWVNRRDPRTSSTRRTGRDSSPSTGLARRSRKKYERWFTCSPTTRADKELVDIWTRRERDRQAMGETSGGQPGSHPGQLGRGRQHDADPPGWRVCAAWSRTPRASHRFTRQIKANFREGLAVMEYFISRTAPAGPSPTPRWDRGLRLLTAGSSTYTRTSSSVTSTVGTAPSAVVGDQADRRRTARPASWSVTVREPRRTRAAGTRVDSNGEVIVPARGGPT